MYKRQMENFLPVRNGVIKRYFDKYKYQRKKREELIGQLEESDQFVKRMMGTDYVHFMDQIPEIKEFLQAL